MRLRRAALGFQGAGLWPTGDQTLLTCFQTSANTFETTIRILGGLLSAHQLSGDKRLLVKAAQLADQLAVAFDTYECCVSCRHILNLCRSSGIPMSTVDTTIGTASNPSWASFSSSIAEVGTLTLEWETLASLTGTARKEAAIAEHD